MNFGKTPMVAAALAAVIGATAIGAGAVSAAGNTSGNGPFADLAQAIATHFNVDATEVQTIIDEQMEEHRAEHQANRQAEVAERLAAAVEAGKLTQEQADALTAHHEEMKTEMEGLRDLSPEEARTRMEAHREEMDAWFESQGIDQEVVRDIMGGPGGRGGMGGGPRGPRPEGRE